MDRFVSAALKLGRSPLGILALFLVLVYAIAGCTSVFSTLSAAQRWVMVLFLVTFPAVVLAVFSWLVVWHNGKLYAPSDYRSDDAFLRMQAPEDYQRELRAEVRESEAEENPQRQPAPVEENRAMHQAFLAQELGLRLMEQEYKQPIQRQVSIFRGGLQISVDGTIASGEALTVFEVKAASTPASAQRLMHQWLNSFLHRMEQLQDAFPKKTVFPVLLIVSTEGEAISRVEQVTRGRMSAMVRIVSLSLLAKRFIG